MATVKKSVLSPFKQSVHIIRKGRQPVAVVPEEIFEARQQIQQGQTISQEEAFHRLGL